MSLVLAILSFFSAVLLPGAVIYKLFIKRFDFALFIITSFIFSIGFNFYLVYVLVLCGLYLQSVVIGIFIIEIILFIFLFKREFIKGFECFKLADSSLERYIFIFGILIALYFFKKIFNADIFYGWDAVVSWDRWATQWASAKFVLNDGGYSQIYPILLSLGYVASAKFSSFQGVGVAIFYYFVFVGVVASIFLFKSREYRIFGILVAILIYLVFFIWSGEFGVGYVDLPVAMVILISALSLLKAVLLLNKGDFANARFYLLFAALCSGVSVEIKQAGLFWSISFIIGLFYFRFHSKLGLKYILYCIGIILFFASPWIIIALYKKLWLHTNATNVDYVMDIIYRGKGYLERFSSAIDRYKKISLLFLISLLALKDRIFRFYAIFGFIYFVFWGTHLSYDLRNLQGGLPLMIMALAFSAMAYFNMLGYIIQKVYRWIPAIFVLVIFIGLIIAYLNEDKILKAEYKRKMTLGGKDTNELVLKVFSEYGAKTLLTNNQLIAYVPAMDRKYYKHYSFENPRGDDIKPYIKNLKDEIGSFYILMPNAYFTKHKELFANSKVFGSSSQYTLLEY